MKNSPAKNTKSSYTEKRPWGSFTQFTKNESSTVKILSIKEGASLSLQYHHSRTEFWHVLSGTGTIVVGKKKYVAKAGKEFSIPAETLHRISATTELTILEIATGHFDEQDIVRIQDVYGRTSAPSKQTLTKKP